MVAPTSIICSSVLTTMFYSFLLEKWRMRNWILVMLALKYTKHKIYKFYENHKLWNTSTYQTVRFLTLEIDGKCPTKEMFHRMKNTQRLRAKNLWIYTKAWNFKRYYQRLTQYKCIYINTCVLNDILEFYFHY